MDLDFEIEQLLDKYFKDKNDKGGKPYKYHLYNVAGSIKEIGESFLDKNYYEMNQKDFEKCNNYYYKCYIVALLHDIFEDTDCTEQELIDIGCNNEIIEAIKSVTRNKNEDYIDFVVRCSKNKIGKLVKQYDLENNMDIKRLNKFDEYEQKRLRKYFYCWRYITDKITETELRTILNHEN